jgi:hypothetical protein
MKLLHPAVLALVPAFAPSLAPAQSPARQPTAGAAAPRLPTPWRHLFDGASLAGWTTTGGRYDGQAIWTVEDGALTGRVGPGKAGGLLYTDRAWHSFDFECDTRIDWPFDSGVFVRMSKAGRGAQVTLDWREGGEIGGIYSDGWLRHNPDGAGLFRKDAWNKVRVRCTGRDMRLEFWLNGEKLTDHQLPPGTEGYAPTGLIGVQVHGGLEPEGHAARFVNVRMRELPVFDTAEFDCDEDGFLTPRAGTGWEPLLDAALSRWETHGGDGRGFAHEGGVLKLLTAGGAHELRTREDFRDFVLRMDFRTARGANSGVFLRADRARDDSAFTGAEIQVLDDYHWEEDSRSELEPWQFTGSLYGAVPAGHRGALYPLGCWNSYEIRCQGSRIRTELNGVVLYDVDTHELEPEQGPKFAERLREGFLGLQRHAPARALETDAYAWFRNVFVKRL